MDRCWSGIYSLKTFPHATNRPRLELVIRRNETFLVNPSSHIAPLVRLATLSGLPSSRRSNWLLAIPQAASGLQQRWGKRFDASRCEVKQLPLVLLARPRAHGILRRSYLTIAMYSNVTLSSGDERFSTSCYLPVEHLIVTRVMESREFTVIMLLDRVNSGTSTANYDRVTFYGGWE